MLSPFSLPFSPRQKRRWIGQQASLSFPPSPFFWAFRKFAGYFSFFSRHQQCSCFFFFLLPQLGEPGTVTKPLPPRASYWGKCKTGCPKTPFFFFLPP